MRKITLSLIIGIILLVTLVYSSELIPQGAINGVGLRKIYNFTNVSTDRVCDDLGTCINTSKLIDSDDLDAVNTSDNIESLGFNITTKLKTYFDTLYMTVSYIATIQGWIDGNYTALDNRDNAINDSDNIMGLYSAKVFYAQEFNGSMNSSNIKNTPAACSTTNSFITEYAGASSTCTSVDFSKIEVSVNLTEHNITDVDCIIFESGGSICTGG